MIALRILRALLLALTIALVAACSGGGAPDEPVDGYLALVPRVLRAGETESVSLSLFSGDRLAAGDVSLSLVKGDAPVSRSAGHISGKGALTLEVPAGTSGDYELLVQGPGFSERAPVSVQSGAILFLETDKPVYKPGQKISMRVITLNSELKPLVTQATVEFSDAKGIKVFKRDLTTDEFGMAGLELPLSTEPNLGVWKLTAKSADTSTEADVRVEEYVLPKYEVKVQMQKQWFLVDEPIAGHVTAKYSFGRPVNGDVKVSASRYVGTWQEFTTFNARVTDGEGDFKLQPAGYVAGVAEAGGQGNVRLDVEVVEKNTGYQEKTEELVTVATAPLNIQIIPESPVFKPSLPLGVMLVSETPDGQPVESDVQVDVVYFDEEFRQTGQESRHVETRRGSGLLSLSPPAGAARLNISATSGQASAFKEVTAAYSPSGNFIHVSQEGQTKLKAGDRARFHVDSTSEARNFYYEVISRDRVVFTAAGSSSEIAFEVTPAMTVSAKLLVYQVLPTSEVAADFIPFQVEAAYPQQVSARFSEEETRPGNDLQVEVQTEGRAKVGLAAVDRSVFILAENRLNLQQVFDQIERLYQQPQAELHEATPLVRGPIVIPGARETFEDAGLLVLSDKNVPQGKKLERLFQGVAVGVGGPASAAEERAPNADAEKAALAPAPLATTAPSAPLAEVQRVRQFFPETWIWQDVTTDNDGKATLTVKAPDSITSWDLRAVAISPEKGLGVAEAELRVFQPFFLQADLPYSAIRGEEFPLKVSLYNYLDSAQDFQVEIEPQPWFELLDQTTKTVRIGPNDSGGVGFKVRPRGVGTQTVKVTARSSGAADAVIKSMIVEPEGVQREQLENGVLSPGATRTINLPLPGGVVPDSARAYVALTGSLLSQTLEGLDQLLAMPYGCGEQNMILFAPDAFILKYLKGTSQITPEVQAKAETLLITGYQRELTYRRSDGSFSAFGDSDPQGSLFLTAFVLKTFAQAKDLVFVDDSVLNDAAGWISSHQNSDGSFEAVGFVAHQELMGGVQGKDALTAYAAIALLEAGQAQPAARALGYLEGRLAGINDPYSLALVTYALELGKSGRAQEAYQKLIALAQEDENGLHWSGGGPEPLPIEGQGRPAEFRPPVASSSDIEATGYAALALIKQGDAVNAQRAAKWLVAHRNSQGGFGSTQDTVVALQALTELAATAASDTEMTVTVRAGDVSKDVQITPDNFDVTQLVDVPAGTTVTVDGQGKGQAVYQVVSRYNLPDAGKEQKAFDISVDYDTTSVSVNDIVRMNAKVTFNPPEPLDGAPDQPLKAGMVVLDIAVPTGFAPARESLDRLISSDPKVKRYDIAGRKVIFYIQDMLPGETLALSFDVKAQYPVRGKGAASQAYSYYNPQWRGETVSEALSVAGE